MQRVGEFLEFGSKNGTTVILAHGAGAPMGSPFMVYLARAISEAGFRVILFNFDYMQRAVREQRRYPPDRPDKLLAKWHQVIETYNDEPLVIGGKSMGGRMASMLVSQNSTIAKGLICLGYPFHPGGRPEVLRVDHLSQISIPTLVCQGERDALGNRQTVEGLTFPENFRFEWLPDGDHSFKPRVSSGLTEAQNLTQAANAGIGFLNSLG